MPSKKISKKSSRKTRVSKKTARRSAQKSAQKSHRISPETVLKVARIARLHLSDDEAKRLAKDLNDVLAAFKELDKAPLTRGIEPSFQPLLVKDVFREDVVEDSVSNEKALANTKHKENKFFKGPRAV